MRKSNVEFIEEVFQRSRRKKENQKKNRIYFFGGLFIASYLLCLGINWNILFKPIAQDGTEINQEDGINNIYIYNFENNSSTFATDENVVAELIEVLDGYREIEDESEDITEKETGGYENSYLDGKGKVVYYFKLIDFEKIVGEYKIYSTGKLEYSDGMIYQLDEAEQEVLITYIEMFFLHSEELK